MKLAVAAFSLSLPAAAIDNGLGITPPMGWRSWYAWAGAIDQVIMEETMDVMVSRKRLVDGKPTSLCDLGYCDIGLDDVWQACGKGTDGFSYHSREGGKLHALINTTRFPDMAAMTARAHKLGLTIGWYQNNCNCPETKQVPLEGYEGDVDELVRLGFDGLKVDGCGTQLDLDLWSKLVNASGRPIVIEACQSHTPAKIDWCPFNFFRVSDDMMAIWPAVVSQLQRTIRFAKEGISKPGCWAYPDMLQIGATVLPWVPIPGSRELNEAESRAHFGAWCIVSSPLILSFHLEKNALVDRAWPLISNREAIAINQAWAGHSGSPFKESAEFVELIAGSVKFNPSKAPKFQHFYKPLDKERVAVLLMNNDNRKALLSFDFKEVPGLSCQKCLVRDVWSRSDIGTFEKGFSIDVDTHDAAFLVLSASVDELSLSPISV